MYNVVRRISFFRPGSAVRRDLPFYLIKCPSNREGSIRHARASFLSPFLFFFCQEGQNLLEKETIRFWPVAKKNPWVADVSGAPGIGPDRCFPGAGPGHSFPFHIQQRENYGSSGPGPSLPNCTTENRSFSKFEGVHGSVTLVEKRKHFAWRVLYAFFAPAGTRNGSV